MFDDDFDDGMGLDSPVIIDDGPSALELGAGYALFRHGQDRQTRQLLGAINRLGEDDGLGREAMEVHVHLEDEESGPAQPINAVDFSTADMPTDWDDYIGQEPLKQQIAIYMASAKVRGRRLPHMLLASGYPGVGKTTMARLVAQSMGADIYEIVPPFKLNALIEAAQTLTDGDVLFIDEIHKLAEAGKRGAEFLLKMLEDGVIFIPEGEVIQLADITVIGATTDRDMLPETVVDRFKIKPYFQAYDVPELASIAVQFAYRHHAEQSVDDWLAAHIALACRGTPRITEEMVMAAQALHDAFGKPPEPSELLRFLEVEPDGLTRVHIHYLTSLRQYFARTRANTEEVEYIVGEAAIQQILRETKQGIGRIERFLVERGLIDRTPRGRRLTAEGIARAEAFIAEGKGAADVA